MLPDLVPYAIRILPGLLLLTGAYVLARRVSEPLLRITVLILGFILIRDAMTPLGFWRFGTTSGVRGSGSLRTVERWPFSARAR